MRSVIDLIGNDSRVLSPIVSKGELTASVTMSEGFEQAMFFLKELCSLIMVEDVVGFGVQYINNNMLNRNHWYAEEGAIGFDFVSAFVRPLLPFDVSNTKFSEMVSALTVAINGFMSQYSAYRNAVFAYLDALKMEGVRDLPVKPDRPDLSGVTDALALTLAGAIVGFFGLPVGIASALVGLVVRVVVEFAIDSLERRVMGEDTQDELVDVLRTALLREAGENEEEGLKAILTDILREAEICNDEENVMQIGNDAIYLKSKIVQH